MNDEQVRSIVAASILNSQVFSKVRFENAHDVTEMIAASQASADLAIDAIMYKIEDRKEQIIQEWIEEQL